AFDDNVSIGRIAGDGEEVAKIGGRVAVLDRQAGDGVCGEAGEPVRRDARGLDGDGASVGAAEGEHYGRPSPVVDLPAFAGGLLYSARSGWFVPVRTGGPRDG